MRPKKSYTVETYWHQENKKASGWCAEVVGLKMEGDKEVLDLHFGSKEKAICYTEVDWKSKKGEKPAFGIKRFFLVDGIFKVRITEDDEDEKGKYFLVAVEGGEGSEITEAQAFDILQAPENLPNE
ncbi:MAG: hypothetical protein V4507_10780 [Verrucomicrobiota bacterium]